MKASQEEEREADKRKISEHERDIRLLVRKVKRLKRVEADVRAERAQYVQEFVRLNTIFGRTREEFDCA